MSEHETLVDRYIDAWNEADPARRRALIAGAWAEDAAYLDPALESRGAEAIDGMIAAVQARFPGCRFRRTGPVDGHHDRIRFPWALAPDEGEPVVSGVDFAVLSPDRRLASVTGFFDA
jgi:hypothetical protein